MDITECSTELFAQIAIVLINVIGDTDHQIVDNWRDISKMQFVPEIDKLWIKVISKPHWVILKTGSSSEVMT